MALLIVDGMRWPRDHCTLSGSTLEAMEIGDFDGHFGDDNLGSLQTVRGL
jgi:hypothetical protein